MTSNIENAAGADKPAWNGAAANQRITLGDSLGLRLTAELGIRHDDNIYQSAEAQMSDTIIAFTPGIEIPFGRTAQIHGAIQFKEAFTRYSRETSPNVNLASGSADFSYQGRRSALKGAVTFRQLNQNNQDLAGLGQRMVYRSDVLNIHASAESPLTAKTALSVATQFNRVVYKTPGVIGSQDFAVPVKLFLASTAKVNLSTGLTYRQVKPQGGGPEGRDMDYNIGARGNFTSKLNGQFSIGYRTRDVGDNAGESMMGFAGSFSYEMTPKTGSTLVLSRDFGSGTQGASLKITSYAFGLTTVPVPQWELGAGISYRHVAYGPVVFQNASSPPTGRDDHGFEGNLMVTYLPNDWLRASLAYIASTNRSSVAAAKYTNNILQLMLGWQY